MMTKSHALENKYEEQDKEATEAPTKTNQYWKTSYLKTTQNTNFDFTSYW